MTSLKIHRRKNCRLYSIATRIPDPILLRGAADSKTRKLAMAMALAAIAHQFYLELVLTVFCGEAAEASS